MYYDIEHYLKYETIWRLNVLLKQKVMLILLEIIVKLDKRRTDGNANRIKSGTLHT